jgi:hypothetical protein
VGNAGASVGFGRAPTWISREGLSTGLRQATTQSLVETHDLPLFECHIGNARM